MEATQQGSALTTKAINLVVPTPIPKVTEVATATEVVVATIVGGLITISSIIGRPTMEVVAGTGCTMVASTKEEATGTGSNVKASTKVLVRSGHLDVLLSPQVMVVQEKRRTMTSSMIGTTSKSANFQLGLRKKINPGSDEHLSEANGRDL